MEAISSGRVAGLIMPLAFGVAILFCLVRVGQTASNEYFFKQPSLEWEKRIARGNDKPMLTWHSADLSAKWEVRYRVANGAAWHTVLARVVRQVDSGFLTRRLVYTAALDGLTRSAGYEYEILRNQSKVFEDRVR